MLTSKYYKITPKNNSYVQALDLLMVFIRSEYDVDQIIDDHSGEISPDGCFFIDVHHNHIKPKVMYITLNVMSDGSWTNAGGHEYCTLFLLDKSKITIRWSTSEYNHYTFSKGTLSYVKYELFDDKKIRKLKLKKLNTVILSYKN